MSRCVRRTRWWGRRGRQCIWSETTTHMPWSTCPFCCAGMGRGLDINNCVLSVLQIVVHHLLHANKVVSVLSCAHFGTVLDCGFCRTCMPLCINNGLCSCLLWWCTTLQDAACLMMRSVVSSVIGLFCHVHGYSACFIHFVCKGWSVVSSCHQALSLIFTLSCDNLVIWVGWSADYMM